MLRGSHKRDRGLLCFIRPREPPKTLCKAPDCPIPIPSASPPIPLGSPSPACCSLLSPPAVITCSSRDSSPPGRGTNRPAPPGLPCCSACSPHPPGRARTPSSAASLRLRAGTAAAPPGRRDGAAGRGGAGAEQREGRVPQPERGQPGATHSAESWAGGRKPSVLEGAAVRRDALPPSPGCLCPPPQAQERPYPALSPLGAAGPTAVPGPLHPRHRVCALPGERLLLGGAGSPHSVPAEKRKGHRRRCAFPPLV